MSGDSSADPPGPVLLADNVLADPPAPVSLNDTEPSPAYQPEQIRCKVCRQPMDKRRLHYGGYSCYSCRAFFRRRVRENRTRTCRANGNCDVDEWRRRTCIACRFDCCLAAGMNPIHVLSDEDRRRRFKNRRVTTTRSRRGTPVPTTTSINPNHPPPKLDKSRQSYVKRYYPDPLNPQVTTPVGRRSFLSHSNNGAMMVGGLERTVGTSHSEQDKYDNTIVGGRFSPENVNKMTAGFVTSMSSNVCSSTSLKKRSVTGTSMTSNMRSAPSTSLSSNLRSAPSTILTSNMRSAPCTSSTSNMRSAPCTSSTSRIRQGDSLRQPSRCSKDHLVRGGRRVRLQSREEAEEMLKREFFNMQSQDVKPECRDQPLDLSEVTKQLFQYSQGFELVDPYSGVEETKPEPTDPFHPISPILHKSISGLGAHHGLKNTPVKGVKDTIHVPASVPVRASVIRLNPFFH